MMASGTMKTRLNKNLRASSVLENDIGIYTICLPDNRPYSLPAIQEYQEMEK